MAKQVYEIPSLTEMGDFSAVTLGEPGGGFEKKFKCWFIKCG